MKKSAIELVLCCGMCLVAAGAFAQANATSTSSSSDMNTSQSANQDNEANTNTGKILSAKGLVGANVKNSQGQGLGEIDEVLINPANNETFAAIGVEHDRYAIVPLQALKITPSKGLFRNASATLDTTKDALQSGPTVAENEWQKLEDPNFCQTVFSHYHVQPRSAMGGVGNASMGGMSEGASGVNTSTNQEDQSQQQK